MVINLCVGDCARTMRARARRAVCQEWHCLVMRMVGSCTRAAKDIGPARCRCLRPCLNLLSFALVCPWRLRPAVPCHTVPCRAHRVKRTQQRADTLHDLLAGLPAPTHLLGLPVAPQHAAAAPADPSIGSAGSMGGASGGAPAAAGTGAESSEAASGTVVERPDGAIDGGAGAGGLSWQQQRPHLPLQACVSAVRSAVAWHRAPSEVPQAAAAADVDDDGDAAGAGGVAGGRVDDRGVIDWDALPAACQVTVAGRADQERVETLAAGGAVVGAAGLPGAGAAGTQAGSGGGGSCSECDSDSGDEGAGAARAVAGVPVAPRGAAVGRDMGSRSTRRTARKRSQVRHGRQGGREGGRELLGATWGRWCVAAAVCGQRSNGGLH